MKRIRFLAHTLGYLKPSQLLFLVIRRLLPARRVAHSGNAQARSGLSLRPLPAEETFRQQDGEQSFFFQNRAVLFDGPEVDWCPPNQTRLWRYQLHYFDALRDPERSMANKCWLIDNWIARNPQGSKPAWEPYTVSLRVINWVAFFILLGRERPIPQPWRDSLYEQVLWLERNDERHLLANHYFENIRAWIFAGVFFQGDDASRWSERGQRLLGEQLREQFLADGAHYERSPQYHAIVLAGCLDLYNLAQSNPGSIGKALTEQLAEVVVDGLRWFGEIVRPDGEIPLFNDSTLNGGPSAAELEDYAAALQLPVPKRKNITVINETASGVYGYRGQRDWFVIKCSDIGPAYQPGHAHCDLLSYELMLNDVPLVVDTGLYEYQPGQMRRHVRSTKAHNTCAVDGDEQFEIWGEFRVARRAKMQAASITQLGDELVFCGQYRGFFGVKGRIAHRRQARISLAEQGKTLTKLHISDHLEGRGDHLVETYIHLHPDIAAEDDGSGTVRLIFQGMALAVVEIPPGFAYSVEPACYCPEFGKKLDNKVIVIRKRSALPMELSYAIGKL